LFSGSVEAWWSLNFPVANSWWIANVLSFKDSSNISSSVVVHNLSFIPLTFTSRIALVFVLGIVAVIENTHVRGSDSSSAEVILWEELSSVTPSAGTCAVFWTSIHAHLPFISVRREISSTFICWIAERGREEWFWALP